MLGVPLFDMQGQRQGELEIDPGALGGRVRPGLLKQAIVSFLANQRQDSARLKGRSDVEGSTRKLYRQKGTGNARAGTIRTPIRRGGGRTFAKRRPRAEIRFPKKMRRLARDSAILAKIKSEDALIVSDMQFPEIKTKSFVKMLASLGVDRGCLVAMHAPDGNVALSARNIPRTEVRLIDEVGAYEVLRRRKLVLTRPAFERLIQGAAASAGGGDGA